MNYREYGIFGEKGQLETLGPYLAQSKLIQPADFYAQALAAFTRNNVLDCIPQNISGTVVYYNKDLFQKANIDFPKAGWTWDDFLKTAQALTDSSTQQYGLGVDPSFNRLMPFIWQNGGDVTDTPPTKIVMDTPAVKEAMQWFVDLQGKYHVVPDEIHSTAQNVEDRFLAGTEGMLIFSRRIVPSLRQVTFDWDVAPLPQNKTSASLQYSDGYCMAKASANKDAAWTLIEYANSTDGQALLAKTGRTVPSLKAVASSPNFLNPAAKPKNAQLFLDMIPSLKMAPLLPNYADLEEAVNQELEAAFFGDESVDAAIKAIGDNTQ
jgi:multiple sugar transport system substrate-binding protein